MIAYYVRFRTVPENREKLAAILTRAAAAMDEVEGCRLYEVALDAGDPAVTVVTEFWTSEESHDSSLELPEARALISEAMPLISERPKQAKLGPVVTSWLE